MAQLKNSAARKSPVNPVNDEVKIAAEDISAEDYANNMFRDGNNRVAHIKQARAYDEASHSDMVKEADAYGDAENAETLLDSNLDATDGSTPETLLAMKQDTTRSRDGTDSSGSLDESGGFLGGTTQEVDNLEAGALPVDKIPHMND